MNALLSPLEVDRLVKVLGLLGSDAPGERAAAGLKAHELIKSRNLSWGDLIATPAPDRPWHKMAMRCEAHAHLFNTRELAFIRSMTGWRGEMSEKQRAWLVDLFVRSGGAR